MIHASKTVTVTADRDHFTITDGGETHRRRPPHHRDKGVMG